MSDESPSGDILLTLDTASSAPCKGASVSFGLGAGATKLTDHTTARLYGFPVRFVIEQDGAPDRVVMYTDGESALMLSTPERAAMVTNTTAPAIFAAWLARHRGVPEEGCDFIIHATRGDPGQPSGDISFTSDVTRIVFHGDGRMTIDERGATPKEMAEAVVKWVVG